MRYAIFAIIFFFAIPCTAQQPTRQSPCTIQASPVYISIIPAIAANSSQWQTINNLWTSSFYNAYKDLPFDQLNDAIKNNTSEALLDYLQQLFNYYRTIALKDSYVFVLAYNENQLVGYTLYHMHNQEIIHIDHFAVDPNCQGKGIGKILLDATIQSKPEAMAVILTTRILNKQAQEFYRKQRFYEIPSIDNFEFDSRYSILLRKDVTIQNNGESDENKN